MAYNDITAMEPTSVIYVQAGAEPGGDGSAEHPYSTIQAAVTAATPGTAILVGEGTYVENVKFPNTGGTDTAPIWLLSADGQGTAHIVAADPTLPVIKALGTDNIMIDGFTIEGGTNGIQFSQSGSTFTNMVENVVITNNTILNSSEDGVKISQADNVLIANNKIVGSGDQGIDFVAVNDSKIADNDVSGVTGSAGIFAKGGSTNVEISGNYVHDVAVDGIVMGGWTGAAYFRPGYTEYEAKNVTITDNYVENVGKRPLNILGGTDSEVTGNTFIGNPAYYTIIGVDKGNPNLELQTSHDILITDNTFNRSNNLINITTGNGEGVVFTGNSTDSSASVPPTDVGVSSDSTTISIWLDAVNHPELTVITGTSDADTLVGSSSSELISGGLSDDTILGGGGGDHLYGGAGGDYISTVALVTASLGAASAAVAGSPFFVDGGDGIDTLSLVLSSGTIDLTAPTKTTTLADGSTFVNIEQLELFASSAGTLHVTGGAYADTLIGNEDDYLDGAGGNDILSGGSRSTLLGGEGDDTITVTGTGFHVDGGAGTDTLIAAGTVTVDMAETLNMESIRLAGGSNVRFTNATSGVIASALPTATAGLSVIGTAFADSLSGTAFADTINGGGGADHLYGGGGNDDITATMGSGAFLVDGGDGIDLLHLSASNETIDLSDPSITQMLSDGSSFTSIERLDFTASSAAGVLNITGGAYADSLIGNEDDILSGGGGDDILSAGSRSSLFGGDGNDQMSITGTGVRVDGGSGTDTLLISGTTTFAASSLSTVENITVAGGATVHFTDVTSGVTASGVAGTKGIKVYGSAYDDVLTGTDGADQFDGGDGNDVLIGGKGNDYLVGKNGNDVIYGGAGSDTLIGGNGTDTLVLTGPASAYTFHDNGDGTYKVTSTMDGVDTVSGFELVRFGGMSGTDTGFNLYV